MRLARSAVVKNAAGATSVTKSWNRRVERFTRVVAGGYVGTTTREDKIQP